MQQPMATHDSCLARSRLDRVYIAQHEAEQLDSQLGCSPLEWRKDLSHHRPVLFFKKRNQHGSARMNALPNAAISHPYWAHRDRLDYMASHNNVGNAKDPITRLTALKKDSGKVRGIVTGAAVRRVVSRALARQFAEEVERATAPFQFALRTRAGTDALGHTLRAITHGDADAVVMALDGSLGTK